MKNARLFSISLSMSISILIGFSAFEASSETLKNPYFFVAEKGGKVIYLFGTQHVGVGIEDLPEPVIAALKRQKVFVTEVLKESDQAVALKPSSEPKRKNAALSPSTIAQLQARGLDARWIHVAQSLPDLACSLYENYEGFRDHLILDEQLEDLATREKKIKVALDDSAAMAVLKRKNDDDCDIEKTAKAEPGLKAKDDYQKRLAAYRAGDMKDAEVDSKDDPYQVAQRNKAWLKKILAHHANSAFVVVGYGHLGGKSGILQLLKDRGFMVRRLSDR